MRACRTACWTGRRRRGEQRGAWHVGAADDVGTMAVGSRCVHPLSSRASTTCAEHAGCGPAPTTPPGSTRHPPWYGRAPCANVHLGDRRDARRMALAKPTTERRNAGTDNKRTCGLTDGEHYILMQYTGANLENGRPHRRA